jgi:phage regulator Rha-like protein
MLDSDLAELYGVMTGNLNKAVKRNIDKFPSEFMFQITRKELQEVIPNWNDLEKFKYRPVLPHVFTEHGVLMTANILNSERANTMSVKIVKVFIQLRDYVLTQSDTNKQIAELRKLLMLHIENNDNKFSEHSEAIEQIIITLNNLIEQPKNNKTIGFENDQF